MFDRVSVVPGRFLCLRHFATGLSTLGSASDRVESNVA